MQAILLLILIHGSKKNPQMCSSTIKLRIISSFPRIKSTYLSFIQAYLCKTPKRFTRDFFFEFVSIKKQTLNLFPFRIYPPLEVSKSGVLGSRLKREIIHSDETYKIELMICVSPISITFLRVLKEKHVSMRILLIQVVVDWSLVVSLNGSKWRESFLQSIRTKCPYIKRIN
jgi:hypothetical protein